MSHLYKHYNKNTDFPPTLAYVLDNELKWQIKQDSIAIMQSETLPLRPDRSYDIASVE